MTPSDPRALAIELARAEDGDVDSIVRSLRAVEPDVVRLGTPADAARPVVLPAYGGTVDTTNLTPLLALLLRRYAVPVLVHGRVGLAGGVETGAVLAELGLPAAPSAGDAQTRLAHDGIAYVDVGVLAPSLARLLMSPDNRPNARARTLARLIDPFAGASYRVVGASNAAADLPALRKLLEVTRANALLFVGVQGEPFVDPLQPSPLEHFQLGAPSMCSDSPIAADASAPLGSRSVAETAEWTERVLVGEVPIPAALLGQLACCLAGAHGGS